MHAASHRGHVRSRNEDAWWFDPRVGVAVVADGMGGHPAGADASALAVEAFARALTGGTPSDAPESRPARGAAMARSVDAAHAGIRAAVESQPAWEGMGTTLTAVWFGPDDDLYLAHVGDSRAYRLRDGRLEALTRDHTWVAEAVATGRIPASAAERHPMSHVLTQAVGVDMPPLPDVDRFDVRPGDVFLLCSDGLTGPVPEERIWEILSQALSVDRLAEAPDDLIDAALGGGGPDNITAVVVRARGTSNGDGVPPDAGPRGGGAGFTRAG